MRGEQTRMVLIAVFIVSFQQPGGPPITSFRTTISYRSLSSAGVVDGVVTGWDWLFDFSFDEPIFLSGPQMVCVEAWFQTPGRKQQSIVFISISLYVQSTAIMLLCDY